MSGVRFEGTESSIVFTHDPVEIFFNGFEVTLDGF